MPENKMLNILAPDGEVDKLAEQASWTMHHDIVGSTVMAYKQGYVKCFERHIGFNFKEMKTEALTKLAQAVYRELESRGVH